jgi:hypothetical protein
LGTFCGLVAAVVYTASNAFLRAVSDCDPIWVSAMKHTRLLTMKQSAITVVLPVILQREGRFGEHRCRILEIQSPLGQRLFSFGGS